MNISNLNELLQTRIVNEGSVSSVDGFALSLKRVKPGFAFFVRDESEALKALEMGAYVLIYENDLQICDKDVFYLQTPSLKSALFRLLRFLSEEKELKFVLCKSRELKLAKAFSLHTLKGDIFSDFEALSLAKSREFFFSDDENYLGYFCADFIRLKSADFRLLQGSSVFYTSLLCNDLYFKNISLIKAYAPVFASLTSFLLKQNLKLNFNTAKIDFYKIYFVDNECEICAFGGSSRAFILSFDLAEFEFLKESLGEIKGFKTALKNSLFCDFSYDNLADLRNFSDFRYCLLQLDSEDEFLREFSPKIKTEKMLFDKV